MGLGKKGGSYGGGFYASGAYGNYSISTYGGGGSDYASKPMTDQQFCRCVCGWSWSILALVAFVTILCVTYSTAPSSLDSDTLYLQTGETRPYFLPSSNLYASDISELVQQHSLFGVVVYQMESLVWSHWLAPRSRKLQSSRTRTR